MCLLFTILPAVVAVSDFNHMCLLFTSLPVAATSGKFKMATNNNGPLNYIISNFHSVHNTLQSLYNATR